MIYYWDTFNPSFFFRGEKHTSSYYSLFSDKNAQCHGVAVHENMITNFEVAASYTLQEHIIDI